MIRTLPGHSLRTLATLDPPRPRVFVGTLSRTGIFCAVYEELSKGAERFRRARAMKHVVQSLPCTVSWAGLA